MNVSLKLFFRYVQNRGSGKVLIIIYLTFYETVMPDHNVTDVYHMDFMNLNLNTFMKVIASNHKCIRWLFMKALLLSIQLINPHRTYKHECPVAILFPFIRRCFGYYHDHHLSSK